uniref:Uncharacterized protein n=1 Tax=Ditylum brightwellii TaxID=49249 RepID=A0A7S4V0M1_9STRA
MTLSHGLFEMSAASLSGLGHESLFVMGNLDAAQYIGESALQMQERLKSESGKAKTLINLHILVFNHVKPLQSFSKQYLEGYQSGMRTGDKSYAMWCLYFHLLILYMTGKHLKLVEEHCKLYVRQMAELKEEAQALSLRSYWQSCLNLMGQSNNTIELRGEAMDEKEVVFTVFSHAAFVVAKNMACNFFGEYKAGASVAIEQGDEQSIQLKGGTFVSMMFLFHRALSMYAIARKHRKKKRKYTAKANRIRKELTASLNKKNPNVFHYVSILNAEHAASEQKKNQEEIVCQLYNDAIAISARGGYVHDAALAQERFGDFLLNDLGDEEEARYHIEGSIKRYTNWGAMGIVARLNNQYRRILSKPSLHREATFAVNPY